MPRHLLLFAFGRKTGSCRLADRVVAIPGLGNDLFVPVDDRGEPFCGDILLFQEFHQECRTGG